MKILHVIISKGFAGSELYTVNLINHQSKNNDTYLIKSAENNSIKYQKFLNKKTKIIDLKGLFKKIKINKLIDQINPDIVHTHLGNASKLIKKKKEFKLVSTLHMNYQSQHYKNHDGLIISNDTQEKKALESFKGKIKRSYLWPCAEKNLKKKHTLRDDLSISKSSYLFGSIGRFSKQKGFDIIIESFKKLEFNDAFLLLIGNGHDEYKSHLDKNIILLDHQDNVADYLSIFDCYISASRWETFGIALVEAMSFNLPIITSVHEGNKEWIYDFDVDIFQNDNVSDLSMKMMNIYKKKPIKKKYNLDRFNYSKICDEILEFYKII